MPNFQDCNMIGTTFTDRTGDLLDCSFAEMQRFKQEIVRLCPMLDYARSGRIRKVVWDPPQTSLAVFPALPGLSERSSIAKYYLQVAPINDSRVMWWSLALCRTICIHKLALEIESDYLILHSCIQLQCFRNVELELARVISWAGFSFGYFGGFWAVLWDCALTSPGGHAPIPLKQV